MEKAIDILNKLLEAEKTAFIENSIICYLTDANSPVPDTEYSLGLIIELRESINILTNATQTNNRPS